MRINSQVQLAAAAVVAFALVLWVYMALFTQSVPWLPRSSTTCTNEAVRNASRELQHYDMDRMNTTSEHVLILTPFKEAARHIEPYFTNINKLTYPHHLISLGFLVSDSTDGTIEKLREHSADFARAQEPWERFHRVNIFQKDFAFELASNDRHAFEIQVRRRQIMARSRNMLLSSALSEEIQWVLWLDGDVTEYPATLLEELIGLNKDVVAPNCFWHSYNEEGGYDRNNWQETPESLDYQKTIQPEDVLVEGYPQLVTHRRLLVDMRNENDETDVFKAVPLDAVGGTCTLVRAQVHREGVNFPAFPYKHQVETEGMAKMAKALGYEVWGLPNYLVFHTLG